MKHVEVCAVFTVGARVVYSIEEIAKILGIDVEDAEGMDEIEIAETFEKNADAMRILEIDCDISSEYSNFDMTDVCIFEE